VKVENLLDPIHPQPSGAITYLSKQNFGHDMTRNEVNKLS